MIQQRQIDEEFGQYAEPLVHLELTLKLQKEYLYKVLNDSNFISRTSYASGHRFQHIDLNGNVCSELPHTLNTGDNQFKRFVVASEHEIIILQISNTDRSSYLILWNLAKKEHIVTTIKWMENAAWVGNILYFKESRMLCYWEASVGHKIQITYYKISQLEAGNPCHVNTCEEYCKSNPYQPSNQRKLPTAVKLNQNSMIGLIGGDLVLKGGRVSVSIYEFDPQKQIGELRKLEFDVSHILNPGKLDFLSARIKDLLEVSHNLFYFQIQTFVDIQKHKLSGMKSEFSESQQRYHTFYYDFGRKEVSVGKINISAAHRLQFVNRVRAVEHKEQQKLPLQKRNSQGKPNVVGVPVFYVEPTGKTILTMNHRIKNNWDERLEWPSYRKDRMYKIVHNAENRLMWHITVYQFPEEWWYSCECGLSTVSVHWLTQIINGCDDDLLDLVHGLL